MVFASYLTTFYFVYKINLETEQVLWSYNCVFNLPFLYFGSVRHIWMGRWHIQFIGTPLSSLVYSHLTWLKGSDLTMVTIQSYFALRLWQPFFFCWLSAPWIIKSHNYICVLLLILLFTVKLIFPIPKSFRWVRVQMRSDASRHE